ncbi:aminotransferase class V-fold PLP-dependent enzyme [Oscillibacter sp. 1-3]|uniref:aminotransferase class V-fold PLP-dependent enzyme n=1 Tax=Oscillibacter sp. 1-3 TaxID=1235797 RepID=UPI00033FD15C|nr:aminotransferase class V-fold PLP-dependent enzyme [Oscillibacter sp. 1-3]EOS63524.1 cysteine desulfurase [Oscillibacter sp. 1-3]
MIYLDSAATTFQKPPAVETAMVNALRTMSSPGRGGYPAAMAAADAAFDCRSELAELYSLKNPEQVVFTLNATHALNIAIKTLVPPGGRVVISGYEHNAVTRPLAALEADVMIAEAPLFHPEAVSESFSKLVDSGVDAVICSHVSNVFGFIQPVEAVAALCRTRGVPLIVDDSQAAGVLPLDMAALGAAFAAMPGHKGLYGPQGTGVLLCGEGVKPYTLLEGGTGSLSIQQEMPEFLPDRLEAGTHNMPGIAGLLAGVRYVRQRGLEAICRRERQLAYMAAEELRGLPGVTVYARPGLHAQLGVLSFTAEDWEAEAMGQALAERGIAVRAGLHCAPLAHRSAGTLGSGTVRLSFSDFNTPEEVSRLVSAMGEILA